MNKTISDYMDICEKLSAERAALEVRVRELEAALNEAHDLIDSGELMDTPDISLQSFLDWDEAANKWMEIFTKLMGTAPALPCAWDRCDTPSHCAQRGACRNLPKGSDAKGVNDNG